MLSTWSFTLSCPAWSSLEELHSSCVLSCLCHPAACDLVQGLCFCPTRSSAVYPQDRSLPLPRNLSTLCLFQFCVFARQTACVNYSIKAITELTFAPGSSVSSDMKSLLTSVINLSQECPHFCVRIYFSNEKLNEIYQVKSKQMIKYILKKFIKKACWDVSLYCINLIIKNDLRNCLTNPISCFWWHVRKSWCCLHPKVKRTKNHFECYRTPNKCHESG